MALAIQAALRPSIANLLSSPIVCSVHIPPSGLRLAVELKKYSVYNTNAQLIVFAAVVVVVRESIGPHLPSNFGTRQKHKAIVTETRVYPSSVMRLAFLAVRRGQ